MLHCEQECDATKLFPYPKSNRDCIRRKYDFSYDAGNKTNAGII